MTTSDTTSTTRPTGKTFTENGNGRSVEQLGSKATQPGEELTSTVKAEFEDIMSDLQDLARRAGEVSGRELTVLRQQMSEQLEVAREKLNELSGDVSAAAHKGVASTEQMIKENPLPAIGIAAVAGIALGLLLNRH